MADYPKFLLAGALILLSAGTASTQHGRTARDHMLAFVSERDGNSEIYVMNVDGTGLLRLTNDAGRDVDPAWSPDGKRIAFASNRAGSSDIYVMNADGSNVVRRTQTGSSDAPAWSPDGAGSRSRACAMDSSAST
jgi:Tol biopolymer transport system component